MLSNTKNYIINKFNNLKKSTISLLSKVCFWRSKDDLIIAPCVGDIIEYEDGQRTIVAYVGIDKNSMYDVRFLKNIEKCVNMRGRQRTVNSVSESCEIWPPQNSKIFRDSQLLYPQKKWKINFVVWLSSKILKK